MRLAQYLRLLTSYRIQLPGWRLWARYRGKEKTYNTNYYTCRFHFVWTVLHSSRRANTKTLSKTCEVRMRVEFPKPLLARSTIGMAVLLETTLGDVVIDLFTEERPKSKKMKPFSHDGSTFYKLVASWVSHWRAVARNKWVLAKAVSLLAFYS